MGIRGVPAQHGGFETLAARLAPHLVAAGWKVTVYCQDDEKGLAHESDWGGVRRVHLGVGPDTAWNSIVFDWACIAHLLRDPARAPLVLTLGYNTALFGLRLRAAGVHHVINMDGIEWAREKWGPAARAWLYLNDWAGCLGGHHLIADHPQIARHLHQRVRPMKVSTMPYGTDTVEQADASLLTPLGLVPGSYATLIARAEPENSVLEIVQAFSARPRGLKLLVLGNYKPESNAYHAKVKAAAGPEVVFPGAIYEPAVVQALRLYSVFYVHGHRVGGTNPSLLEAMGAGNAVLAHDNRFNRWVVGEGARYFSDASSCAAALDEMLSDPAALRRLGEHNRRRAGEAFSWPVVLGQYEATLAALHARATGAGSTTVLPYAGNLDTANTMDLT